MIGVAATAGIPEMTEADMMIGGTEIDMMIGEDEMKEETIVGDQDLLRGEKGPEAMIEEDRILFF